MAHYDCSNCGERMGVSFGTCGACTPKEYRDAVKAVTEIANEALRLWEVKDAGKAQRRAEKRRLFIEKQQRKLGIEAARDKVHCIQMVHHHSYRHRYERELEKKEAP